MNNLAPLPGVPIALLLISPFVGSFLGVWVERIPSHRPLLFARSNCDHCESKLPAHHLIPLLSWVALRGRCNNCKRSISVFYPSIELASIAVVVWAALLTTGTVVVWSVIYGWMLLTLAWIDWRAMRLPDVLTIPLAAMGVFATLGLVPDRLADHLIGMVLGFIIFVAIAAAYRFVRRRDGLGFGDAKLLAALGSWVSWTGLPSVILYGAALACFYVLTRKLMGKKLGALDRIPFGTFLAMGGWLVWLYGPIVIAGPG